MLYTVCAINKVRIGWQQQN